MVTRWIAVALIIFLASAQEYAFQDALQERDTRAAIESARNDPENEQKNKEKVQPAYNPFDFERAGPETKGARIIGPYGDPRKKDPSMLHNNGKLMRSRKDYSAHRRQRAQYDTKMRNGQNWFYSIVSSNITHLVIGVFVLGILAKICIRRGSKNGNSQKRMRDHDAENVIKFSNSCFEENMMSQDVNARTEGKMPVKIIDECF